MSNRVAATSSEATRPRRNAVLIYRTRVGLWAIVASNVLFALTDLRLATGVLGQVYAIKLGQLAVVTGGFALLRRSTNRRAITAVILVVEALACVLVALSGVVTNDVVTTLILCLAMAWGSAIILPWGTFSQAAAAVIAAGAMALNVCLTHGSAAALVSYPAVGIVFALAISVFLAFDSEQHRAATAAAQAAVEEAQATLERRVQERTGQLESANVQLRRTSEALRDSEQRFRIISELTSDYAYAFRVEADRRATVEWLTTIPFRRITGFTPTEVEARGGGLTLVHPDDLPIAVRRLERLLAGETDTSEFRIIRQDGTTRWIREYGLPETDPVTQQVVRIYGAAQDITQRKLAEQALQESQRWLQLALHAANISLWSWNIRTNEVQLSPRWIADLGYAEGEIPNTFEEWATHLYPADHDRLVASVPLALQRTPGEYEIEFRLRHRDGSYRWILSRAQRLAGTDGEPERLMGCHIDITERKRVEEQQATLLELAKDTSGTLDFSDLIARVQQRAAELLECDVVLTFAFDAPTGMAQIVGYHGLTAEQAAVVRALRFTETEPFGGRLRQGETIVINDMAAQPWFSAEALTFFRVTALLAVPLQARDHYFGALVACHAGRARPFQPHQVALFEGIARQLALADETAELYRLQRREAEVSGALARVGHELITSLGTPTFLDRLCEITAEVLGCDTSHTLLWREADDAYAPVAGFGATREEREIARVVSVPRQLMAALIARLQETDVEQLNDLPSDFLPRLERQRLGQGRLICMALRRGDMLIGLQVALARQRDQPFDEMQVRIAAGIAHLASVALEHARVVDELNQASRLKSEFVATMSHELRTPLNIIIGYTNLLADHAFGALTPEQLDTVQRVDRSAHDLLELVNSTLNLSRFEAGEMPLAVEDIAVAALIGEVRSEIHAAPDKPDVRLVWCIAPDLPRMCTDAIKLKIVLKNLMLNAVKFTERGSVTLAAARQEGGVVFTVTDTGIGIAADALPIIFEAFRQADSSTTRHYGGVGLGLYIVRRFVDVLGGTVQVHSELGKGSTFRVWLPLNGVARRVAA